VGVGRRQQVTFFLLYVTVCRLREPPRLHKLTCNYSRHTAQYTLTLRFLPTYSRIMTLNLEDKTSHTACTETCGRETNHAIFSYKTKSPKQIFCTGVLRNMKLVVYSQRDALAHLNHTQVNLTHNHALKLMSSLINM
jgi:hypothetical protein